MKKKRLNIAILVIAMFLLSSCTNVESNEATPSDESVVVEMESSETTDEKEDVYRIDLEKEIKFLNALKKEHYEKDLLKTIDEKTKYAKKDNTVIYANKELTEPLKTLEARESFFAEKVDSATGIATVKDDYYSTTRGYMRANTYHDSKLDFISRKYDGVDYTHEIPFVEYENNPRVKAKGIYLTINTTIDPKKLDALIKKANETEINAFVIDVKNDSDNLLFQSEAAKKYNPKASYAKKDISEIMNKLKENDIYTIARVVAFKSPQYALENPERAITYKGTNTVYKNRNGVAWASAYDRELWDYNIEISKEAARLGFNEIQFDYVRFPALTKSARAKLDMKNTRDENRTQAIHNFLKKAREELSKEKVYVAADIFGWATSSISDEGIGQHWEALTSVVDYTCPMIYPSHYGPGIYGLAVPDAHPYRTVYQSAKDGIERNKNVKNPAIIRPWIQDFTARWVKGYINYGPTEVRAQIQALEDLGIEEFILWAPGNNYTWEAIKPAQN
ncbi:MAG TPA: putative glycoside hydrolase [Clostridia bacterium]|nr:putative glycoside hydrolase [Clostridia bacterium]